MVIIFAVPIMANILLGFIDLFKTKRKKTWFPEKLWQGIVLVTLIVEMTLSAVDVYRQTSSDFLISIVNYLIIGLIAYAILTGQAYLTFKESARKKKSTP